MDKKLSSLVNAGGVVTDKNHNDDNCIYKIQHSDSLGRYLVAGRDIEALEVVIREEPSVCAPADDPNYEGLGRIPMCLGCFAKISNSATCSTCGWPVCDENCEIISHHSKNECEFFSKKQIPFKTLPFQHLLNETIFILRILLLKRRNPDLYAGTILKFEHHTQVRQEKAECVEKDDKIIANLLEIKKLSNDEEWFDLDEKEIIQISGIINVNAFSSTKLEDECRSRRVRRRVTICQCLYPTATLLAHQCIPNCSWTISASPRFEQTIRSTIPIAKGEMISIAYAPQEIMWPTLQRLISSNDVAHFICRCDRCLDPAEFGTLIGAIKCTQCTKINRQIGDCDDKDVRFLLPIHPTDPESLWMCQNPSCTSTKSVEQVIKIVHRIERHFNRIKGSVYSTQMEIAELEELYEDSLQSHLHKNHYLLQEISLRIVNRNALAIYCLDSDDIERFLFHCNSLLNLSQVLSPGYCRARALIQFYASQAMMVRARKWIRGRELDKNKLYEMYSPILKLQKLAYAYFSTEDENDNRYKTVKGSNQYVACLMEEMEECLKSMKQ